VCSRAGEGPSDRRTGQSARSFAASTQEEHELLELGVAMFEGLYTVLKQKA
jgi:hypothetical protein